MNLLVQRVQNLLRVLLLLAITIIGQPEVSSQSITEAQIMISELQVLNNLITNPSTADIKGKKQEWLRLFTHDALVPNNLSPFIDGYEDGSPEIIVGEYAVHMHRATCCESKIEIFPHRVLKRDTTNLMDTLKYDQVAFARKKIFEKNTDAIRYNKTIAIFIKDSSNMLKISGIVEVLDADADGFQDNGEDKCPGEYGLYQGCLNDPTSPPQDTSKTEDIIDDFSPLTQGGGSTSENPPAPYKGDPDTILSRKIPLHQLNDTLECLFFEYSDQWRKLIAIGKTGELLLYRVADNGALEFQAYRNFEKMDHAFMYNDTTIHFRTLDLEKSDTIWTWKETAIRRKTFTKADPLNPPQPKHYGPVEKPSKYLFSSKSSDTNKKVGLVILDKESNHSQVLLHDVPVDPSKVKMNQSENCLVALGNDKIYIWKKNVGSQIWQEVNNHHDVQLDVAKIISKIEVDNDGNLVFLGTHHGQVLVYIIT